LASAGFVEGYLQAFEDVGPLRGPGELEAGPADDDLAPEIEKLAQKRLEAEDSRLPVDDGEHDDAETRLHLRVGVELVQDHLRDGVPLQVHDDPHAVPVRFIPQVGDAFDLFEAHQGGDLLDETRFVHLIGQLRDNDALSLGAAVFFHRRPGPQLDDPSSGPVGFVNTAATVNEARCREVRSGYDGADIIDADFRVVDHGQETVDDLAQVVGWYVGRHSHGDPRSPVDEKVGKGGRQYSRLLRGAVEVVGKIHRFLVDIDQELSGKLHHTALGVTVGGGRIAVDGTEVALTVDQRVAQVPGLGHAHQGVIDGGVSVGMILLQHLSDDTGALAVSLVALQTFPLHGVQNPPVHGFEAVPRVGQRPSDDHRHGVVQVGLPHLVFDIYRQFFLGHGCPALRHVHQWSVLRCISFREGRVR
jgi:hypothetical protein